MYLEQAIKSGTRFSTYFFRYALGLVVIAVAFMIGQVPFTVALLAQSIADGNGMNITPENMMGILDSNLSLFLYLLCFAASLIAVFVLAKYLHGQSVRELTTSRPAIDYKRMWFSFLLWGGFSVVSILAMFWLYPEDFVEAFQPVPFAILFVVATVMIPIQTSAEEYIFRGYLMQGIGAMAGNRLMPLMVTSVLFGAMHLLNPEVGKIGNIVMIYYIGTGFFLGIMTLMDEGMELALGFHAANNWVAALLVTSDWTAFQTHSILKNTAEPDATLDVLLPVLVIYPIILFIFSKKYGWRDWTRKLTGKLAPPISTANTTAYGNNDPADLS